MAVDQRTAADREGAPVDRVALRHAWLRGSVGAAAAMLVGGFLAAGFVAARYEARLGRMAREAAELRTELRQREGAEELLGLLTDPTTQIVVVQGVGPARRAHGRLVWRGADGGRLVLAGLPALPPDRVYRAWIIEDGHSSTAGSFRADRAGRAVHALPPAGGRAQAVSVTLESVTGARAPTGPVVLSASLPAAATGRPESARSGGILEPR
jgi:hypothetical protein